MRRTYYSSGHASMKVHSITIINFPQPYLPRGMSAVHAQVAAGHEAAGIAQQEHSGAAVLLRAGQTAQHVLLGPLITTLGEVKEELFHHGGDDVAGGDGVDADVVLAPLGGEVATELDDSGLACVVGGTDETLARVSMLAQSSLVESY